MKYIQFKKVRHALMATVVTVTIAGLAVSSPLEDYLSKYRFVTSYPWYAPWRVGTIMIIVWIISSLFSSSKRALANWIMLTSAIAITVAYYAMVSIEVQNGLTVKVLPLVNLVEANEGSFYRLDVAQLIIILSAIQCYSILKTSPRTPSGKRKILSR
ncbi:MAG: hypothetical protein QW291_07215 [Thermofilaceae archaeon]